MALLLLLLLLTIPMVNLKGLLRVEALKRPFKPYRDLIKGLGSYNTDKVYLP